MVRSIFVVTACFENCSQGFGAPYRDSRFEELGSWAGQFPVGMQLMTAAKIPFAIFPVTGS